MEGIIGALRTISKRGEISSSERTIIDVSSVHDCGIVDIDFDVDGKRYSLQFSLSDLVRDATIFIS